MGLISRVRNGWNAFLKNRDPTQYVYRDLGASYSSRPDRPRLTRGNERSIVTAIFNRIALDVASLDFLHCKVNEDNQYVETIKSDLNDCLTVEANIDQTAMAFKIDLVLSMLDEGDIAIVPVDTDIDPEDTDSYKIQSIRVGKVIEWYPQHVKVRLYNERTGHHEDVILEKRIVGLVENPLRSIMNEPNSVLQRLIRKLNLLDSIDEQSGSGKLDLIIQLPYVIKSDARREQAEKRRKDIEMQLSGSKYGIAYTDGTERITQLNRPVENNLMKQIEYLTNMLYSQLGFHQTVLDGTADEKTMLNYYNRTIGPIADALVTEMRRKFLTKTARTKQHSIIYLRDPFKLVPVNDMAEIADKFTRNEILTSNEIRQIIGRKPSKDPKADKLVNSNIAQKNTEDTKQTEQSTKTTESTSDKADKAIEEFLKE